MEKCPRIELSKNGPEFSRIIAGVWKWGQWGHNYNPEQVSELIKDSVNSGITTFDHADIYGDYTDEELFGKAFDLTGIDRDQIELVSKCGIKMVSPNRPEHGIKSYDYSEEHIVKSVDRSLRNLNTDYLDLLLLHRPSPLMDPHVIAGAFNKLKHEGKVKNFGVSNFTPSQFSMVNSVFPLVTNQVQISPLHLDCLTDGTLDQCIEEKIKPMAWSPLGSTGMFSDDSSDEKTFRVKKSIAKIAEKYNEGIDVIILAWHLKHPAEILPVLGTGKGSRLRKALGAFQIDLTNEEWFDIYSASLGEDIP
ncbi:aldo/keto reductase [Mangrovivirga sp. M17]|uniref:Aldo/keto reductase n=1 Tax=Mangrovivirga halotolerans TaxID=2993936 RepID=A0ABT3RSZ4_9BACT|nr:aldo/keto reductase [Mangrovivirga halotolerans]MCX2744474.1 aldo/keto reductase [Mangrovivirga halotolerans]